MTNATYNGTRVLIGLPSHGDPPPTAVKGTDENGNETYTYSDGIVRVWYKSGKKRDQQKIFCPNAGDAVTVTVKRLSRRSAASRAQPELSVVRRSALPGEVEVDLQFGLPLEFHHFPTPGFATPPEGDILNE